MLSYGISAINLVEFPVIHEIDNVGIFTCRNSYQLQQCVHDNF